MDVLRYKQAKNINSNINQTGQIHFLLKSLILLSEKLTKNDIHSQFDVIFESENIIRLNPDDQKLKMLNVEHINVILDDHDIVVGANVVYKSKTLKLIPTSIMNN